MQQRLKFVARAARAKVVASKLLKQFLVAIYHAMAALHVRLGRIPLAALAGPLKRTAAYRNSLCFSWHTPLLSLRHTGNTPAVEDGLYH
jgi:hypothetical protein